MDRLQFAIMLIFLKAEEIGIEPIYTDLESAAFLKLLQAELYTTYKSKYIYIYFNKSYGCGGWIRTTVIGL